MTQHGTHYWSTFTSKYYFQRNKKREELYDIAKLLTGITKEAHSANINLIT